MTAYHTTILRRVRSSVNGKEGICRCKVRMSGLCKVEMSASMEGRGAHGTGADRFEPTRTGPIESVARGKAEASCDGGQKLRCFYFPTPRLIGLLWRTSAMWLHDHSWLRLRNDRLEYFGISTLVCRGVDSGGHIIVRLAGGDGPVGVSQARHGRGINLGVSAAVYCTAIDVVPRHSSGWAGCPI